MRVSQATRRQLVSLGVLASALALASLLFSPAAVARWLTGLSDHLPAFLAVLFVCYLARPFLMVPVSALSITAGFVLGIEVGAVVAITGTMVSNTIPFFLARHARTENGLLGSATRSSDRVVETTGELRGVVAARLAPLPADVVSSASGLSGVSFGSYMVGTLVGESPWIVAEVIAGSSMQTLSVHGLGHSVALFAGATALSALLLAGPVYRHFAGDVPAMSG